MKTFRYKFLPIIYLLLSVVAVAVIVGASFCVRNALNFDGRVFNLVLDLAFLAVNLFVLLIVALALIVSRYEVIEQKGLFLRLGIFRFNMSVEKISQFIHVVREQKLVVKYQDDKFISVVISQKKFDEFYSAVHSINDKTAFLVDNGENLE